MDWERRKILIWGKTRPELSKRYFEVVCTGGVFEDTKKLARIYPIPLRLIDDSKVFRKYQWIIAWVAKNPSDPRPESYKIRADQIEIGEEIKSKGTWLERAYWVMSDGNKFQSLEELKAQQEVDKTSLGIIKPKNIIKIYYTITSERERDEYNNKRSDLVRQMEMFGDWESRHYPLRAPEVRFKVVFNCDDPRCTGHDFSMRDWEIDAAYAREKHNHSQDRAAREVLKTLKKRAFADDIDLHFFLGNMSGHPQTFSVVGLWYPQVTDMSRQQSLF